MSTECFHIRVTCKRTIHLKALMKHVIWVKRGSFLFKQLINQVYINKPSSQPSKHSFIKSSINRQQLNALDTYKRQFIHSCMHSFI